MSQNWKQWEGEIVQVVFDHELGIPRLLLASERLATKRVYSEEAHAQIPVQEFRVTNGKLVPLPEHQITEETEVIGNLKTGLHLAEERRITHSFCVAEDQQSLIYELVPEVNIYGELDTMTVRWKSSTQVSSVTELEQLPWNYVQHGMKVSDAFNAVQEMIETNWYN